MVYEGIATGTIEILSPLLPSQSAVFIVSLFSVMYTSGELLQENLLRMSSHQFRPLSFLCVLELCGVCTCQRNKLLLIIRRINRRDESDEASNGIYYVVLQQTSYHTRSDVC